jgi:type II secretory pathway component PulK
MTIGDGKVTISYETQSLHNKPIKRFGMQDEESRINLNTASLTVLANLLEKAGGLKPEAARQVAAAIIDWRDTDSTISEGGGAETGYYLTLQPPYQCKNAPFDVPEELLLVKGVNPAIFSRLKPYITVWGEGQVNINTAPFNVLLALGLPEGLADKILRFRAGKDEIEGTADDNIITKEEDLASQIKRVVPLVESEISLLNKLVITDLITVESEYYRIIARGDVRGKTKEIVCIVQREGPIVFWQEL